MLTLKQLIIKLNLFDGEKMVKSKDNIVEFLMAHREVAVDRRNKLEAMIKEFVGYANALGIVIVENEIYLELESQFKDVCSEINSIDSHLQSIEDGTLLFVNE